MLKSTLSSPMAKIEEKEPMDFTQSLAITFEAHKDILTNF